VLNTGSAVTVPTLYWINSGNRTAFLLFRSEDFLHNAEHIIPMIYHFIQEPYEASKIKHLLEIINKENCDKWKKMMHRRQIRLFESVAANTLKQFGYETRYEERKINKLLSSSYLLQNVFMRAIYLFNLNFVDTVKIKLGFKQPFAE